MFSPFFSHVFGLWGSGSGSGVVPGKASGSAGLSGHHPLGAAADRLGGPSAARADHLGDGRGPPTAGSRGVGSDVRVEALTRRLLFFLNLVAQPAMWFNLLFVLFCLSLFWLGGWVSISPTESQSFSRGSEGSPVTGRPNGCGSKSKS